MNNPWYDKINGGQMPAPAQPQMNPMAFMGQISQAMRNPQYFAMREFPDVPAEMWRNPEQALQHIMKTRGLSQADIQNLINNIPIPR